MIKQETIRKFDEKGNLIEERIIIHEEEKDLTDKMNSFVDDIVKRVTDLFKKE